MLDTAAHTYSEVFAPEFFVLLCGSLVVGYEWAEAPERTLTGLCTRLGVLGVGWGVALAVYEGVPLAVGSVPGGTDVTGSVGLGVGLLVVWAVWRIRAWGERMPEFAALLVAATIPHLLVTPVWNLSSHVLYAATPVGSLLSIDERFAPLAVVPLGMVVGRPLAGAHTWAQSVAGFALAAGVVLAFRRTTATRR